MDHLDITRFVEEYKISQIFSEDVYRSQEICQSFCIDFSICEPSSCLLEDKCDTSLENGDGIYINNRLKYPSIFQQAHVWTYIMEIGLQPMIISQLDSKFLVDGSILEYMDRVDGFFQIKGVSIRYYQTQRGSHDVWQYRMDTPFI